MSSVVDRFCTQTCSSTKLAVFVRKQVLIVQAMRPDRLQSAMSLFASRALGKVHSHNNQYFSVSLLAPLYIMLTCIYARLGWSLRIDVDFLKVFSWLVMPFKGLFIPVWREIFRSKILPVTS